MDIFEQFRSAERKISELGPKEGFILFGLFQRDDLPTKYDVVASATWLISGLAGLTFLIEMIREAIGTDWWRQIGRFVIVPEDDPLVLAVLDRLPEGGIRHEQRVLHDLDYEGDVIRKAVIITAVPPAVDDIQVTTFPRELLSAGENR